MKTWACNEPSQSRAMMSDDSEVIPFLILENFLGPRKNLLHAFSFANLRAQNVSEQKNTAFHSEGGNIVGKTILR